MRHNSRRPHTMPGLTDEQDRLKTRLNEMQTADNWRGIVAQEGAALALGNGSSDGPLRP